MTCMLGTQDLLSCLHRHVGLYLTVDISTQSKNQATRSVIITLIFSVN